MECSNSGTHSASPCILNLEAHPRIEALSASVSGAHPSISPVRELGSKGLFPLIHWQDALYLGTVLSKVQAVLGKSLQ